MNALQKSTLKNMHFFAKNTSFYVIFFEFGRWGLQCGLSDLLLNDDFEAINKGAIAELFIGLELLKSRTNREAYVYHRKISENMRK